MKELNATAIEQMIQRLPSIQAVHVLLSEQSEIDKIYVMALPGTAPKKIVRDIETLLVLKFGYRVDYRKISLVQGRLEDLTPFIRARLRLLSVESRPSLGEVQRVLVSLADSEQTYLGTADTQAAEQVDSSRLAAQATLDALQSLLPDVAIKDLAVEQVGLGSQLVTLVAVTVQNQQREEVMLGSALVRGEPLAAAARATLDALNRRFFSA